MSKLIFRLLIFLILITIGIITYLSFVGIETKRFNKQIEKQIKNIDSDLQINLNKIKIVLNPIEFKIKAKTIGTSLKIRDKIIEIEGINGEISINSLLNKKFSITNLEISTKTIEIKKLISFARTLKNDPKLYILERIVKKGFIIADINLEFDTQGILKKNYNIKGIVKDGNLKILKKYEVNGLNFIFNIVDKNFKFEDISLNLDTIPFSSNKILVKKIKKNFFIEGDIKNKKIKLSEEKIPLFIKRLSPNLNIESINFNTDNKFSFKVSDKLDFDNLKISSNLKINHLLINKALKLKNIFPKIKKKIEFLDHEIKINYSKKNLLIDGEGAISFQQEKDKVRYKIDKDGENLKFLSTLTIKNNPLIIDVLGYEKNKDNELKIDLDGNYTLNKKIIINSFKLTEKKNTINFNELVISKDYKINSIKNINLDYYDNENKKNQLNITKKNKNYFLEGPLFNSSNLLRRLNNSDGENKKSLFAGDFGIIFQIDQIILDKEHTVQNFKGDIIFENNEILKANLDADFSSEKKLKFTVNTKEEGKIITLFLDKAKPAISQYSFIKGFENGSLDFYSIKEGNRSKSTLKIYDFKLKEVPALTKLLTLASLQGIADILTGEGIRFDEFEMNYTNEGSLIEIEEIYAIGPAISILMNGYVEKNKVVSLRGTLVPATTINKVIGSIPVLGKILVGQKTGEGVFGVSFKIKGPPKKLETTVNPIKTLTPRFITRTIEKIKKN